MLAYVYHSYLPLKAELYSNIEDSTFVDTLFIVNW